MTNATINEQKFDRITTYGKTLDRTDYADGYNVGTIVTYDVGWSMSLPKFALIVRRTPKMIETVVLPTTKQASDGYGFTGHEAPVSRIFVPERVQTRRTRMGKHGFSVDGHYTKIWDGSPQWYDHMD